MNLPRGRHSPIQIPELPFWRQVWTQRLHQIPSLTCLTSMVHDCWCQLHTMAIDRLYYFVVVFIAATFLCHTHYAKHDGSWHRPRNQYKKKREKAAEAAKAQAGHLAEEIEEAPRYPRRRPARAGASRNEDKASHESRYRHHHQQDGPAVQKRYRKTPHGPFVKGEELISKCKDISPQPLHAVHTQQRHSNQHTPAAFAQPDHTHPGHNVREDDFIPYAHLYGAYDDQMHAPFEGT